LQPALVIGERFNFGFWVIVHGSDVRIENNAYAITRIESASIGFMGLISS
jgi:hypothetical protein